MDSRIYGDSYTIGVLFQDYDTSRIQELVVSLGAMEVGRLADAMMIGTTYGFKLKSSQTIRLFGTYDVIVTLKDSTFGVRSYNGGQVSFSQDGSGYSDTATDAGVSYLVTISPLVELVEVDAIIIDAFEGHSPYIGENGNWYEWSDGEYVDTEVHAQGIPGVQPIIGENGNWYIWDDTEYVDTGVQADYSDAEEARDTAEGLRDDAEGLRDDAEGLREAAEALRKTAETSRNTAEGLRDDAEGLRLSAEVIRQENETERIALAGDFAELIDNPPIIQEDGGKDYWYFWDLVTNTYVKSTFIAEGESSYAYIAYASDDAGADFSLTPSSALTYMAVLSTNEPIASPQASDFAGLWRVTNTSQAAIDKVEDEAIDRTFKTLNIGTGGLVTFSPTTRYFTYRLNVLSNLTLNIDLHRMIEQVGNARCRLIIDMPVVKTIVLTNPILWGGTVPTFSAAGQYIFEIIDVDGSGTPLIWQVASTTKAQTTGVILYVDSAGADYSGGQINGETAARTTSTWGSPFRYLQNAINAASAGDIIFVKAGTYYPTHLRTTPTSYADGDHLLRDATFSQKAGVDVYGGFLGTETKTWQRVVDADGYPVNKTIFSGDILREAAIDPAKTVGDRRTDASKANAAYNVVYANVASYTYLNGVEVKYGSANGASSPTDRGSGISGVNSNLVVSFCIITGNTATNGGGGTFSSTVTNCTITGNTAANGGGTFTGTITNCTITGNTASANGGGTYLGTVTNCTITGNTAASGGGTRDSTVTNSTITGNTATTNGGGTLNSTVTNCTITGNTASSGGGTYAGTVTNCTITGNTASTGGGTFGGTVTNCILTGNTATSSGGGTYLGTVTNCTITNNKGENAIFAATTTDTHYNNLVFGNKTSAGVTVAYDDKTASGIKIFRNNAYDTAHPTITGATGSDIDTTTCIQNLTLEQAGIMALSFAGVPETPEQWTELNAYISEAKARPKGVNLLKAAGINSVTYPAPTTDITGAARPLTPNSVTIGAYESE